MAGSTEASELRSRLLSGYDVRTNGASPGAQVRTHALCGCSSDTRERDVKDERSGGKQKRREAGGASTRISQLARSPGCRD